MKLNLHTLKITCLFAFLCFCNLYAKAQQKNSAEGKSQTDFPSSESLKGKAISYKILQGINNTWGYDILVGNQLTIHQPSIPGMPGNEGFKTKAGAERVAKLVIGKMKKGEMPPAISIDEMKKLNTL